MSQELHLSVRSKTDDSSCLWFETPNTLYDTPSTQLLIDPPRDSTLQNPFLTPYLSLGREQLLYPIREVNRLIFMVLGPTGKAENEYKRIGLRRHTRLFNIVSMKKNRKSKSYRLEHQRLSRTDPDVIWSQRSHVYKEPHVLLKDCYTHLEILGSYSSTTW